MPYTKTPAACPSEAMYFRHWRNPEVHGPPCEGCIAAHREANRARARRPDPAGLATVA